MLHVVVLKHHCPVPKEIGQLCSAALWGGQGIRPPHLAAGACTAVERGKRCLLPSEPQPWAWGPCTHLYSPILHRDRAWNPTHLGSAPIMYGVCSPTATLVAGLQPGGVTGCLLPCTGMSCGGSPVPALLADELTCSARLTVQPSVQPLFTRKLEDVDVVEGRTARFVCMISGTPPPTVTWTHFGNPQAQRACQGPYRETPPHLLGGCTQRLHLAGTGGDATTDAGVCLCAGLPVQEGENVRIQQDGGLHSLVIVHVGSEDEGQYKATARNTHGHVECSAELYVEEPRPSAASQM